jgi:hypothetical protein
MVAMPIALPVLPMSIDAFHVMDHRLGWKHEYWDGAARLSCQHTAVAALELQLSSHNDGSVQIGSGYRLSKLTVEDASELITLFLHSFDDAIG